ncbi:MAG: hypothetical protein FWH56_11180 [Betaproteobacteria bacterium]|nr:hypothetical protein [Betaproteobacteria bacterium]
MSNHEESLVTQYVHKIQALAVRAEAGDDVQAAVEAVVTEAVGHFRIIKTSDPQANLSAFQGRLKIAAEIASSSQPALKRTLQYAAKFCSSLTL